MAGAFGYGAETYDASLAMAELSLLPTVRARRQLDTLIVADGASCRHQIGEGTAARGAPCRARARQSSRRANSTDTDGNKGE